MPDGDASSGEGRAGAAGADADAPTGELDCLSCSTVPCCEAQPLKAEDAAGCSTDRCGAAGLGCRRRCAAAAAHAGGRGVCALRRGKSRGAAAAGGGVAAWPAAMRCDSRRHPMLVREIKEREKGKHKLLCEGRAEQRCIKKWKKKSEREREMRERDERERQKASQQMHEQFKTRSRKTGEILKGLTLLCALLLNARWMQQRAPADERTSISERERAQPSTRGRRRTPMSDQCGPSVQGRYAISGSWRRLPPSHIAAPLQAKPAKLNNAFYWSYPRPLEDCEYTKTGEC